MIEPFKLFLAIIVMLLGLYYYTVTGYENFTNQGSMRCPDLLIQKGTNFYLYNSNLANVPGVNPVTFENLEEYTEFIEWQRSQGIRCPVLYVQESYDAQGNKVYKPHASPTNIQGGLTNYPIGAAPLTKLVDASRSNSDSVYNKNSYPGFDGQDQTIGTNTPLDLMYHNTSSVSPNPMDANWGGQSYTKKLVDSGYYAEDYVTKPTTETS